MKLKQRLAVALAVVALLIGCSTEGKTAVPAPTGGIVGRYQVIPLDGLNTVVRVDTATGETWMLITGQGPFTWSHLKELP